MIWFDPALWRQRIRDQGATLLFVASMASLWLLFSEYLPTPEHAQRRIEREYAQAKAPLDEEKPGVALVRLRSFVRNYSTSGLPLVSDAHREIARALQAQADLQQAPLDVATLNTILSELRLAAVSTRLRAEVDPLRLGYALRLREFGALGAAREVMTELLKEGSPVPGLRRTLAETLARLDAPTPRDQEEAFDLLARARQEATGSSAAQAGERARLWLAQGAMAWKFGRPPDTERALRSALGEIEGGAPIEGSSSMLAEARYGLARVALAAGHLEEVAQHLQAMPREKGSAWDLRSRLLAAMLHRQQNHLREALAEFCDVAGFSTLSAEGDRPDEVRLAAAFQAGDTFALMGDLRQAVETYLVALKTSRPFPSPDLFDRAAWDRRLRHLVYSSDETVLDLLERAGERLLDLEVEREIGVDLAGGAAGRKWELARQAAQAARDRGDAAGALEWARRADASAMKAGKYFVRATQQHISVSRPGDLYWRAGEAFVRAGYWAGAIPQLINFTNSCSRDDERRNEALFLIGRGLQDAGDYDLANAYFDRNLQDPDLTNLPYSDLSRLAIAEGDLGRGKFQTAISGLKAVLSAPNLGPGERTYRRAMLMMGEAEYSSSLQWNTQGESLPMALESLRRSGRHLQDAIQFAEGDPARRLRGEFFLGSVARELSRLDPNLTSGQRRRYLEQARDAWQSALRTVQELDALAPRPSPARGLEEREIAPEAISALAQKTAFLLADVICELGDEKRAFEVYRTAQARYQSTATPTDLLWALIQMGKISGKQGRKSDASTYLEQAQFTLQRLTRAGGAPPPGLPPGMTIDVAEWQALIDDAGRTVAGGPP